MRGGHHGHAFDVELELGEVGHGRKREADVVHLEAAGEQARDQRLLHRGRVPTVVVTDDEALVDAALGEQRRHAEADGVESHEIDLLRGTASGRRTRGSRWASPGQAFEVSG